MAVATKGYYEVLGGGPTRAASSVGEVMSGRRHSSNEALPSALRRSRGPDLSVSLEGPAGAVYEPDRNTLQSTTGETR